MLVNCTIKVEKHFQHEHVWVMVKDDPKWQMVTPMPKSSKRTKNNESGAYTSSSNADTSVGIDEDEAEVRPTDQKAAKEKSESKRKGKEKGVHQA